MNLLNEILMMRYRSMDEKKAALIAIAKTILK